MGKIKVEIQMQRQFVISKSFKLSSVFVHFYGFHSDLPLGKVFLIRFYLQRNGLNNVDLRPLTD